MTIAKEIAQFAAASWGKDQTKRVFEELQTYGLLKWSSIGKTWPYILACDFYVSHGPNVYSRAEATKAIQRHARDWGASEEFVFCLFALGYLAQDTITSGFAMAVALANNAVIRDPFLIVYEMGWDTPFFEKAKGGA